MRFFRLLLVFLSFQLSAAAVFPVEQVDVRVLLPTGVRLEWIEQIISIDRVEGRVVYGSILNDRLVALEDAGLSWTVLRRTPASELSMCPDGWENLSEPAWDCYPSYGQYVALMRRLATEYPDRCVLHSLGSCSSLSASHEILALKITDRPIEEEAEPEIFLTSTMHGDEIGGYVLLLRLAWTLVVNPDAEAEIDEITAATELWINPLANPDGTFFGGDESVAEAVRFLCTTSGTISAVDPNRNFPDFMAGPFPFRQPWAVETLDMMHFGATHSIVLSANLHSGAEVVNYPWDTTCRRHPDEAWFKLISTRWAADAREDGPAGYMDDCYTSRCTGLPCPAPGVTGGADWYSVAGGRQDWMSYFENGRELTVEISDQKMLPSGELEQLWSAQHRALLDFIVGALHGIHGVVVDSQGRPLSAKIEVLGHDDDTSVVFTDPDCGDFHRLLAPGIYDLSISSKGMKQQEIRGIEVPADGPCPDLMIVLEGMRPQSVKGACPQ